MQSLKHLLFEFNKWRFVPQDEVPFFQKRGVIFFSCFIDSICSTSSQWGAAALNPLFHFTQTLRLLVNPILCPSLWFDISFHYVLPVGSLLCDDGTTWRVNTGTKCPSSSSLAKAQSGAACCGQGYDAVKTIRPRTSPPSAVGHWRVISGQRCFVPHSHHVI